MLSSLFKKDNETAIVKISDSTIKLNKSEYKKFHYVKRDPKIISITNKYKKQGTCLLDSYPFKDYYSRARNSEDEPEEVVAYACDNRRDSIASIFNIETELSQFIMETKKKSKWSLFSKKKNEKDAKNDEPTTPNSLNDEVVKSSTPTDSPEKKITKEDEIRYANQHKTKFANVLEKFETIQVSDEADSTSNLKSPMLEDIRKNLEIHNGHSGTKTQAPPAPEPLEMKPNKITTVPLSPEGKNTPLSPNIIKSPKLKLPSNRQIVPLKPRSPSVDRLRSPTPILINNKKSMSLPRPRPEENVFKYDNVPRPKLPPQASRQNFDEGIYATIPTNYQNYSEVADNRAETMSRSSSMRSRSNDKTIARRSVENYYWNEIKKMEAQKQLEYQEYQRRISMYMNQQELKRSQSMSPALRFRTMRNSIAGNGYISEGEIYNTKPRSYPNNVVYHTLDRSQPSGPIFRRGSIAEEQRRPLNTYKNVRFSRNTPTENYQVVPEDDDVFYANSYTLNRPTSRLQYVQNPSYYVQQPVVNLVPVDGRNRLSNMYDPGLPYYQQQVPLRQSYQQQGNTLKRNSYAPSVRQEVLVQPPQDNPNFIRNSRLTSSTGNIKQLSKMQGQKVLTVPSRRNPTPVLF